MKEICDRCGKQPVAKYKLQNITGEMDCTILDELWLCVNCLPRAVRKETDCCFTEKNILVPLSIILRDAPSILEEPAILLEDVLDWKDLQEENLEDG